MFRKYLYIHVYRQMYVYDKQRVSAFDVAIAGPTRSTVFEWCVLQDPHDSERANSWLLPEDSAASEVLPTDVRGDGKERTTWGMISQVKCYLQMSGVMGKNELHEVWFLKWSVTHRCQGWWERTNYMRYDFSSEVLPTDVRGDGKERTTWGMIS